MFLILGNADDPCCAAVKLRLRTHGHRVEIVEDIFSAAQRFAWRCAGGGRHSRICAPGRWSVDNGEIEGVMVRQTDAPVLDGWSEEDAQYMVTEMKAALLGWLWSLDCAVVNRLPAWLWYQPRTPFLSWVPMLHRAGLQTPAMAISNDARAMQEWRSSHATGAAYAPLTSAQCYPLQTDAEWDGAMRVARYSPLMLREAHGETRLACVVRERVIWDHATPRCGTDIESRLVGFARSAGLNFVQIAMAELANRDASNVEELAVVAVETQVQFQRFGWAAREVIAEAVADLMSSQACDGLAGSVEAADAVLVEGGSR